MKSEPNRLCRVEFVDVGTVIVPHGTNLLEAALEVGINVPQQCGGFAICSWCKMTIVEGSHNLSPESEGETRLQGWNLLNEDQRASCQTEIEGDLRVRVG